MTIDDLWVDLVDNSIDGRNSTAVFIIKNASKDNVTRFLVEHRIGWGCYFLPYTTFSSETPIQNQTNEFERHIANYIGVDFKELNIEYLDSMDLKRVKTYAPSGKEKLFDYKFFYVNINAAVYNVINKNRSFLWKSIEELKNDGGTMLNNSDVIMHLDKSMRDLINKDSYSGHGLFRKPIKIIWNITNKCPYKCDICATNSCSERNSLTYDQKIKALLSISTAKKIVKELEFAGGDPLLENDDRHIIKYANQVFSTNIITVSSTGKSLEKLSIDEIKSLFSTCDITLDYPPLRNSDEGHRKGDYNYLNYKQADRLRLAGGINVNVHTPIVPENMREDIIAELAKCINEINPNSISLIRLMPVGRLKYNDYPQNYSPEFFINTFTKYIHDPSKIKLHCALRGKFENNPNQNYCNLLEEKIGIDSFGNVYSCAWAGNLDIPKEENPFYLGNILESDLEQILFENNIKVEKIMSKVDTHERHCRLFSYLNSTEKSELSMFLQKDPLHI